MQPNRPQMKIYYSLEKYKNTDTLIIFHTYYFSTATVIMWMHLSVTLNVYHLSFLSMWLYHLVFPNILKKYSALIFKNWGDEKE